MLIRFAVENWMSFKERAEFSMVASREIQHSGSVFAGKHSPKLLPVAAVYGGNAAGKTNFFKALNFVRNFILTGSVIDGPIATIPFKLSKDSISKPSRFEIEVLIDKVIYEYSFELTNRKIFEEKLILIQKKSRRFDECVLFHRVNGDPDPHLSNTLTENDRTRLKVIFEGTRDNVLFLTNAVFLKINAFKPVFDWFLNNLEMVGPDSRFMPFDQFFDEASPLYDAMNGLLPQFDTSISTLCGEEIPFSSIQFKSERDKQSFIDNLKENMPLKIWMSDGPIIFERIDNEIKATKLITMHKSQDGDSVRFDIKQESDGSQRMIDLLPAFLQLASHDSQKVYVIDEIDRSLHSLLTRSLVEMFLDGCDTTTRKQLIFTTHDVLLMDQELLRRDEMWVTERTENGESQLFSLCEYKELRDDTDIKKRYLDGRLGGIPLILKSNVMNTLHASVNTALQSEVDNEQNV